MEIRVLHFDGCPNARPALEMIASIVGDRPDVDVSSVLVRTDEEAARVGMHGSPTILVDGVDPFAPPGTPTSLSCRVYLTTHGASGLPDSAALRRAIAA